MCYVLYNYSKYINSRNTSGGGGDSTQYPDNYIEHILSRTVSIVKGIGVEEAVYYSKHELHVKGCFQSVYNSNYWNY